MRGMATLSLSPLPHPVSFSISNTMQTSFSYKNPKITHFHSPSLQISIKRNRLWRRNASSESTTVTVATPVETSQQIVSASDDPANVVVSVLLFIAFVILSLLTIGVIYIGVTDFLQKREREKFEREEASKKKKKSGKKPTNVRAKGGPRGFGQKVYDEDDED